jgi:flagellar protein FlbD
MITLHRLSHTKEELLLNPDLIVSVESTPDTVITLATSAKVVVADSPEQVTEAVRDWRVQVLSAALRDRSQLLDDVSAGTEPSSAGFRARGGEPARPLGARPALAAIGGGGH